MRLSRIVTVTLFTLFLSPFVYAQPVVPTAEMNVCNYETSNLRVLSVNLLKGNTEQLAEIERLKTKIAEMEKTKDESVQEPTK